MTAHSTGTQYNTEQFQ